MTLINIFIIEDDTPYLESLISLLNKRGHELFGKDVELNIVTAANQSEATALLSAAPPLGFNLILLDLKYPINANTTAIEYLGLEWLPELRLHQIDAAIVVMSSYGYEQFFINVVKSLRDGHADDFVPKNAPWEEMRERIREALRRAADRAGKRVAARDASLPMPSMVAPSAAADILRATQAARLAVLQALEPLALDASPTVGAACDAVRKELDALDSRLTFIASKLARPKTEDATPVNCALLARDLGSLFGLQLAAAGGLVETRIGSSDTTALTYESDLKIALREILQNAVFGAQSGPGSPKVTITVSRRDPFVAIDIADSGPGFSDAAKNQMFAQDNSQWGSTLSQHSSGMGLHIARRMMLSIGGEILAENREGHAHVTLLVRDWATA